MMMRSWASDELVGLGPLGAEICVPHEAARVCKAEPGALVPSSVTTLGYLVIAGAVAAAIGCVVGGVRRDKRMNAVILVVAGLVAFVAFQVTALGRYAHLSSGPAFYVAIGAAVLALVGLFLPESRRTT